MTDAETDTETTGQKEAPTQTIGDLMKAQAEPEQPLKADAAMHLSDAAIEAMHASIESLLRAVPGKWAQPPETMIAKLARYVGPKNQPKPDKQHCQECGQRHEFPAIHLDYMGHADVTLALIEVDPMWNWEPTRWSDQGEPLYLNKGGRLVMWGWLTVLGKRVLCVGTCESGKSDPEKELIGDLLRNGAMRFGIGTKLWSKADDEDDHQPRQQQQQRQQRSGQQRPQQGKQQQAKAPQQRTPEDDMPPPDDPSGAAPAPAAAPAPKPAQAPKAEPAQAAPKTAQAPAAPKGEAPDMPMEDKVQALHDMAEAHLNEAGMTLVNEKLTERNLSWVSTAGWTPGNLKLVAALVASQQKANPKA